jgi:hypothetical protein
VAVTANRNLTGRSALQPGEYCVEDSQVLYACKRCGGVDALNAAAIAPDGRMSQPWNCSSATCPNATWLRLEDFSDVAQTKPYAKAGE